MHTAENPGEWENQILDKIAREFHFWGFIELLLTRFF
jgi:hypothetical protein